MILLYDENKYLIDEINTDKIDEYDLDIIKKIYNMKNKKSIIVDETFYRKFFKYLYDLVNDNKLSQHVISLTTDEEDYEEEILETQRYMDNCIEELNLIYQKGYSLINITHMLEQLEDIIEIAYFENLTDEENEALELLPTTLDTLNILKLNTEGQLKYPKLIIEEI